ncbi:TPA: hypothetical protein DEP96_00250 [Candidatus Uhrbacteria bacterium]|nr:hypothetical protein [Candidatus Uhrbacteria bacterium]
MGKAKAQQQYKARQPEPGAGNPNGNQQPPQNDLQRDVNRGRGGDRHDQQPRRPDQPTESPAARIERIAKEALELRNSEYERAIHDQEVIQDLIDGIKIKTPAEQCALRGELKILETDLRDALEYITRIEFEDRKSESWEQQIAAIQTIPEADRTPKQNDDLQQLFDSINDLDHRMKQFNINQPATNNNKLENKAQQATAPLIGSPEWKAEELQKKATKELEQKTKVAQAIIDKAQLNQRLMALHENLNDLPLHPALISEIKKIENQISDLDKIIPQDPTTAKTIIPGQIPAPAPEKGSPEWMRLEAQKSQSAVRRRTEALAKLADYEIGLRHNPSVELEKLIAEQKKLIKEIEKDVPASLRAEQTKAPERVLSPAEIIRQKADKERAELPGKLAQARYNIDTLDDLIAAQDKRTIAGREKIAQYEKDKKRDQDFLNKHEQEPIIIRQEVINQVTKLDILAKASSKLYEASAEFGRDKTDAQKADLELQDKQKALDTDYQTFLEQITTERSKLPDFQQQALSKFPINAADGPLTFTDWTNAWWNKINSVSLWRPLKLKADTAALDSFKNLLLAQDDEDSFLSDLQTRHHEINALRDTYNQRVTEQQEYTADFIKKLNTAVKAGLPELPKNLNDDERQALMDALLPTKTNLDNTIIPREADATTLKRFGDFHKKVTERFIALRDNVGLPIQETKKSPSNKADVQVEEDWERVPKKSTMLSLSNNPQEKAQMKQELQLQAKKYSGQVNSAAWATREALLMMESYEHIDKNTLQAHLDDLVNKQTRRTIREVTKAIEQAKKQVGQDSFISEQNEKLSDLNDRLTEIDQDAIEEAWEVLVTTLEG